MPGMPQQGGDFRRSKTSLSRKCSQKIQKENSWASKEPQRKKQNYRPSPPCSFVFPPDSSPSSRGVQAGNADSAQSREPGSRGLYTAVTSQRTGCAIGQPRGTLQGIMGGRGAILCNLSHLSAGSPNTETGRELLPNLCQMWRKSGNETSEDSRIISLMWQLSPQLPDNSVGLQHVRKHRKVIK